MKGIILAGGSGTRLHPTTVITSKQLLPVYNKPMIYYPLSTLMLGGISDILIISTPEHQNLFQTLLGDGSKWGIKLSYAIQEEPAGLAQAFLIGEEFIGNDKCCLILGDNFYFGHGLGEMISNAVHTMDQASIFAYWVREPQRYGVLEMDKTGNTIRIEEKPTKPKSNWAVTGLYLYDNSVIDISKNITPSPRGELEITDVNNHYIQQGTLKVEFLGRGFSWMDMGTHESLLAAGNFVQNVEERQGLMIACLEEVALAKDYIDRSSLLEFTLSLKDSTYRDYLMRIVSEG
jgi:glucose-1-phosphate thymidylyltransferase